MNSNEIWRGLIAPLESIDLIKWIEKAGFKVIGRCEDCRFFSTGKGSPSVDHRKCLNGRVLGIYDDKPDGIHAWNANQTSVGPKFGCIHWEGKL